MAAKNQNDMGNFAEDDVSRKRIRKEQGVITLYFLFLLHLESRDKRGGRDGQTVDHSDTVRGS